MPSRYDASTKAKAVRLVREHAGDYPTQWAAITAVSGRLGMSAETLRKWVLCRDRHKTHYADLWIMPMLWR